MILLKKGLLERNVAAAQARGTANPDMTHPIRHGTLGDVSFSSGVYVLSAAPSPSPSHVTSFSRLTFTN